jgi:EKC/KEOPS complex subunit PCC1/LAGE3
MAPSATSQISLTTTDFPCSLTISTPFPTPRLAQTALRALSVDAELSPLVQRAFSLASTQNASTPTASSDDETILLTHYTATTNRMLRVAVNGFFESLGVVVACMRELDVDVAADDWVGEGDEDVDALRKVQGLEERGVIGNYTEGGKV